MEVHYLTTGMSSFRAPFGGSDKDDEDLFDSDDEFVPEHLPEAGPLLADHDVLTGEDHVVVHRMATELFEERGVYDVTFGYNLAQLNLDTRHPDAGYRYAEKRDDPSVLCAVFTPTTAFCPQSETLTKASFRAWNGLSEKHEYDLVKVRVDPMHQQSQTVNNLLENWETRYLESGDVTW